MPSVIPHTVTAANRFGLGARPDELRVAERDARGWLQKQVRGKRQTPAEFASLPGSAEVFRLYSDMRQERAAQKASKQSTPPTAPKDIVDGLRKTLGPVYLSQVAARYQFAVRTEESFRERLVHFWTNHFAVSVDKPQVLVLAATLENEAIRPHIAGRFCDLLLAVEQHPAMILYLDNQQSVGPHSTFVRRAAGRPRVEGRKLDINENLAREILELHTLGVDGGYAQADVTSFARALTGWSIGGGRGRLAQGTPGTFVFRDGAHEPGTQTLLGTRYSQEGIHQPRAILSDLAKHPATARHIATKLVRHFVADAPPPGAVDKIARAFLDSDGDLPTVHAALVDLPEAWSGATPKFKTPHDFVISSLRMIDAPMPQPRRILASLQMLGQRPYSPGSPAGWPDTADQWDGPDALLNRIEWASVTANALSARLDPVALGDRALGASLTEHTRASIRRAASAEQGTTLLLVSPEFQRR